MSLEREFQLQQEVRELRKQLAALADKVREQCAQVLDNGFFLTEQSPEALIAKQAAVAIRAMKEDVK